MAGPSAVQHHKNTLHKWFGPNRGTHWTIAGSVAVIILGSYLIYNNRNYDPIPLAANPAAAELTRLPTPAAPRN
jgi:hypothetical protein